MLGQVLRVVFVLLGISFVSFLLMYISPGDPVSNLFAINGTIPTQDQLNAMREELGLDRPFLVQYVDWLASCLQGDFGTSYSTGAPVMDLLLSRLAPTLALAVLSLMFMLVIAVPIGVLSALNYNKWPDTLLQFLMFANISLPNFWVGLVLLYIFAVQLDWVPVVSVQSGFGQLILPAFTLALAMSGQYARQVRTALLEELSQDYVIGARARGIRESTILWKHIMPNALLPLVTLLGLSVGSLLGGTAVVEIIFSYPALGSLAIDAITSMDYPLIQGYVLWVALIYMIVNLAVDISYGILDPRVKKKALAHE